MSYDYTLYAAELSYFSGKARCYMRYKDLNWEEQLPTREIQKTVILPNIGAPIIPVLATADGQYIQDTSDIIDFLEARHPGHPIYPDTPKQKLVALLLELFGDEWLVIPAMHYRWSYLDQQYDFIMGQFGSTSSPNSSHEEQVAIGEKVSQQFRGIVPVLGVNEQTIPGIELAHMKLLAQLDTHFSKYDYLLGSRPSIGDFGLIGPLYAHLGRDPYPKALMQEHAPAVYRWVERMNHPQPLSGEFLPNDEVPETLIPILQTLSAEQLPDVLDVIKHNAAWLDENPGGNIPRFLGMHEFTMGGITGERWISSFSQWMFQRPLYHYQSLAPDERQAVDELLHIIGGYEPMQVKLSHPVKRKKGQLELVAE